MKMAQLPRPILTLGLSFAFAAAATAQTTLLRQIPARDTAGVSAPTTNTEGTQGPELDPATSTGDSHDGGNDAVGRVSVNRTIAKPGAKGYAKGQGATRAKSNPEVNLSLDGLNFNQQRYADGGNQFSIEPPDQGLCAGNGFVLESVNDVLRVFTTSGTAATSVVSLNQFYGYPSAINRQTGAYGPDITDPSCYYDQDTQRWFHVVLTLDRAGTSRFLTGSNHLDLAVSRTSNPLGAWTVYSIPVQNDGSQGTPNHHCAGGPCLGDYPHIGADKNGIYLTTNEFDLFGPFYEGAQIYALSKQALVSGASSINVAQYNTGAADFNSASGLPGFTVWPAISAGSYAGENGGTEYMLSSLAIFQDSGVDNRLQLWSLINTSELNRGGTPTLVNSIVNTEAYGIPGYARQPGAGTDGVGQKPGGGNIDWPLGQCLNIANCSAAVLGYVDPRHETISPLAGNDSRMQQVYYANGKLWASLGTGLGFTDGSFSDGLAYFVLHPFAGSTPTAGVVRQGYVGLPNLDLTYGTVAVTESGRGTISFTTTGPNDYPGVGYASLDAKIGAGDVHIAAPGVGVQDGFSGYYPGGPRPRWGDYGASAVDGNTIWFAQEYINQSCSLGEYLTPPVFRCGNTRGALGNWSTRIVKVTQ